MGAKGGECILRGLRKNAKLFDISVDNNEISKKLEEAIKEIVKENDKMHKISRGFGTALIY